MWALLLVTLPSRPGAVRLRVWRSLKALGCAALRDGAYVLPAAQAAAFAPLADEVRRHGGSAHVLALAPLDDTQRDQVLALFDRREAYAQWRGEAQALAAALPSLAETEARRRLRAAAQALDELQAIDHYPGAAGEQATAELDALRHAVDARYAAGEPRARATRRLPRLDRRDWRGKRWATRARPWVDRLASAWLIRRFVDPQARFLWLQEAALPRLPRGAVGFDFDGARFTHQGPWVTFEVLMRSFGLDEDTRLQRIGALVHVLDAGGIPVPEAAGLSAVLAGLRELHADDDALLAAAGSVFDALMASPA
ncbi:MAG: chromate resistance protein [Rubrivivax sp.]